jgi:hypothetical protein
MRTAFFIEDSPEGLITKFVRQGNGCQDNPSDSIAMHLQTNISLLIRGWEKKKLLRFKKGLKDKPSVAT